MQYEFFDPAGDVSIYYRHLPHWDQPGVLCFITYRTIDSIPAEVLNRWRTERAIWLRQHDIEPLSNDWRQRLQSLSTEVRRAYHIQFTSPWMECLDRCHGDCVLKQPHLARIVADNFLHFDERDYFLSDFVVMPNHVHVLAQFRDEGGLQRCCRNWKHFTARRINAVLGQTGHFWQVESFDHLVRSPEQFEYLRNYIARNPVAAGLRVGEYWHYRKS
jgi:putative transposase